MTTDVLPKSKPELNAGVALAAAGVSTDADREITGQGGAETSDEKNQDRLPQGGRPRMSDEEFGKHLSQTSITSIPGSTHQELNIKRANAVNKDLDEVQAAAQKRINDAGYDATVPTTAEVYVSVMEEVLRRRGEGTLYANLAADLSDEFGLEGDNRYTATQIANIVRQTAEGDFPHFTVGEKKVLVNSASSLDVGTAYGFLGFEGEELTLKEIRSRVIGCLDDNSPYSNKECADGGKGLGKMIKDHLEGQERVVDPSDYIAGKTEITASLVR